MDTAYLNLLLDFNYWARDRVIAAVAPLSPDQYRQPIVSSFPSIRETLNHGYSAEWIWHARWVGESPTAFPPGDELPDLNALSAKWNMVEQGIRSLVGGMSNDDLNREYDYKLLSGKSGRSKFWEMFVHVVNHASYHRGQVTTMLRQVGAPPPESTDMITFIRLRAAP